MILAWISPFNTIQWNKKNMLLLLWGEGWGVVGPGACGSRVEGCGWGLEGV